MAEGVANVQKVLIEFRKALAEHLDG